MFRKGAAAVRHIQQKQPAGAGGAPEDGQAQDDADAGGDEAQPPFPPGRDDGRRL